MKEFKEVELQSSGIYPSEETNYGYPHEEYPILNTPVTPRENFKLFFERGDLYWIPDLGSDVNLIYPDIIPDCFACKFEGGLDSFGVKWIPVESNDQLPSFVEPGKPKLKDIADWRELKFPDVDSWDWEESGSRFTKNLNPNRMNMGIILSGYFERLISLLDFSEAAMALLEDPESVHEFFKQLTEYNISIIEHYKKHHKVDIILFHDDWGAQRAPFFSKTAVKDIILPYLKLVVDRTHELGMKFILHSCGRAEGFVPEMIEAGVDVWQVQINANPNIYETMKKYKDQILFDVCEVIPEELNEDNDGATNFIKEFYQRYGQLKATSISILDMNWERGIDWAPINYEFARKVVSGEILMNEEMS